MDGHGVRLATNADTSQLAAVMAQAFLDDPLLAWVLPDEPSRLRRLTGWFEIVLRLSRRHHEIYTTEGVHGGAVWAAPGRWRISQRDIATALPGSLRLLRTGTFRFLTAMGVLEKRHPSEPHWYLAVLGTDPTHQGRGVGAALMRPVLDRCDRAGLPAYLETQKERNVPYYERHGFRVTGELVIPKGGPRMWLMWREPVPPEAA